jgi:NAD-dependent deacetylase
MGWIITQNIDGLHSLAGSKHVIELHGSIHRNYCISCHKTYDLSYVENAKGIPKCSCGGLIRPDVVLYGESLKDEVVQRCINANSKTNLLIVAGTRLDVSTASSVFQMFRGQNIIILNNESTAYDKYANIVMHDDLSTIFKSLN